MCPLVYDGPHQKQGHRYAALIDGQRRPDLIAAASNSMGRSAEGQNAAKPANEAEDTTMADSAVVPDATERLVPLRCETATGAPETAGGDGDRTTPCTWKMYFARPIYAIGQPENAFAHKH